MTIPKRLRTPIVAKYLGVSTDTVRRYAQTGRLPARRIGGVYQYRVEDVAAFIEAAALAPPDDAAGEVTHNSNTAN